jgi:hypothetical protein
LNKDSRGRISSRLVFGVVTILVILVIGGVSLLTSSSCPYPAPPTSLQASQTRTNSTGIGSSIRDAADYLIRNFNPEVGLIPETPGSATYWLYSDNYLAALALQQYGAGNSTIVSIAGLISNSLRADLPGHLEGVMNQYLVLNSSSPCQFHTSRPYTLMTFDTAKINATLNNGTALLSESQYADIAFLNAICLYREGNASGAMAAYDAGRAMFDGSGLRDLPFDQTCQYQTFKLALYVYAGAILGEPVPQSAVSALLSVQAQGGGFYTGYNSTFSHQRTLTNTETTSLAVLALNAVLNG